MKAVISISMLLFLASCGYQNQASKKSERTCDCDGLVDWQTDPKILLYDYPNGQIFDTLSHDINGENFLIFTISESEKEFFKVTIGRAIDNDRKTGWIKKANYLGTYASNYSDDSQLFLYNKPDRKSDVTDTINKYYPNLYVIKDCEGEWAKVNMVMEKREVNGWIEPEMQCANPYTTCN